MGRFQQGAGCVLAVGLLTLLTIPLEAAWGWLRTGTFVVSEGQDVRLLVGSVLFLLGLAVAALTSPPQAAPSPMTWRAALLDAVRSVPRQLLIWLVSIRLLHGHLDLRSALDASVVMFGLEALRNRFPIAPWRRKSRASASDRSV